MGLSYAGVDSITIQYDNSNGNRSIRTFDREDFILNYKIMNILFPNMPQFVQCSALVVRSDRLITEGDEETYWVLGGPGKHDFTTFFNSISIGKWRQYTSARRFGLHIELKGASAKLVQTKADSFSWYSEPIDGYELNIDGSEEWSTIEIELASREEDVLESFLIECDGLVQIRNAYYYAIIDEVDVRPIELALCTTTYKKEDFIKRNIELVRQHILNSGDRIAKHFKMHVVDNGRSLDASALSSSDILIHPNDNAGGAGGFARGMIEAMEQSPKATHVLLMDDDVVVSPESIVRTFNLLTLVNDEYKNAFISGAMMNLDEPNIRWEEMGFMGRDGMCHSLKPVARMDILHDVVDNETFDIPSYMPKCDDQEQHYAAWWYCAIPVSAIEANGLPLPIFVRYDDVEYGLRCRPNFMTMNGICIWHMHFYMRYSAGQECYQTTRNSLINSFTTGMAPKSDFEKQIDEAFRRELARYNYKNAELILDGIEDFLKGPEWIMKPVAQQAFMDANKKAEKYVPFKDLITQASEIGCDLNGITDWKIWRDYPQGRFDRRRILDTCNGQRGLGHAFVKGKVAIVDVANSDFPIGKLKAAEYVVAIDVPNRRGVIRRRNHNKFKELWSRYEEDKRQLNKKRSVLKKEYLAARSEMTSVEFWKKYLAI